MDGNFATLIEQLAQQQRIISQLRNENRELKDKNSHLVRKLTLLEVQQPIQAMRPRKQIFSSHSSPIKFLNVPKQEEDDELSSIRLAAELQRQEENQFHERLRMLQPTTNIDDMDYEQIQQLQEQIGFVSKGFKPAQIDTLLARFECAVVVDQDCTICFSNETGIELPCRHNFHRECLSQWFQQERTCPLCKLELQL